MFHHREQSKVPQKPLVTNAEASAMGIHGGVKSVVSNYTYKLVMHKNCEGIGVDSQR